MPRIESLEPLFKERGYNNFTWMDPADVVISQWVRMKCQFGCEDYGRGACCPPNTPSVTECQQFFNEYTAGVIFHFEKQVDAPEDRHEWGKGINRKLLELEREVFISGYERAFLIFMDSCSLCGECVNSRAECRNPEAARPSPESLAVDVFSTVRKFDLPISVLSDYTQPMNRYAFLLIE